MNLRTLIGIALILFAIFYAFNDDTVGPADTKIEKPEAAIAEILSEVQDVETTEATTKRSAVFLAMSEGLDRIENLNNTKLQFFNKAIGTKVIDDTTSNPTLSSKVAAAITKVVGPQTENEPIVGEELDQLKKLYSGVAYYLYSSDHEEAFETYKAKADAAVLEYLGEAKPDDDKEEVCICDGSGWLPTDGVVRLKCPALTDNDPNTKCKSESREVAPAFSSTLSDPILIVEENVLPSVYGSANYEVQCNEYGCTLVPVGSTYREIGTASYASAASYGLTNRRKIINRPIFNGRVRTWLRSRLRR
jgi:hypothetical protein